MDIVLGVSMTPAAVRMVLVEGENADGATVDRRSSDISVGDSPAIPDPDAADHVVAAILGTRESAAEGGHRLRSTGVAWTDHAAAARLRRMLRAYGIDDVVLVSELHAASALAQAVGRTIGCERIGLLFLERDTATLAVVRAGDGVVVRVDSRSLRTVDEAAELEEMVAGLATATEPPQSIFVVGSGVGIAALMPRISAATNLPVHAPDDAELALARGAALAAAASPRFEASTVGLAPGLLGAEDTQTALGVTQLAAADYMAPLGYSAVAADEGFGEIGFVPPDMSSAGKPGESLEAGRKPFLLAGSALSTVFVVGIAALMISLAVVVRPTADQQPTQSGNAAVPSGQTSAVGPGDRAAPETIQAPIPVAQWAPRTVVVAPDVTVPGSMPESAPPVAAAALPVPAAPVPVTAVPAQVAPAPLIPPLTPPIVVPVPSVPVPSVPVPSVPVPIAQPPTTSVAADPATTPSYQSDPAEPATGETVTAETVTAETVTSETVTAETVTSETVTAETAVAETAVAETAAAEPASEPTTGQAPSGGHEFAGPSAGTGSGESAASGSDNSRSEPWPLASVGQ